MDQHNVQVGIVLGSASDWPEVEPAVQLLHNWGITYEVIVASAHRSPVRVQTYASQAAGRGLQVIIAVAGAAAHLAGVLASETILPVIGVPIASSALHGMDSLLATVQMPAGTPVATMALGAAGAQNAAIFAVQILARQDPALQARLTHYKQELAGKVEESSLHLQDKIAHLKKTV
ncbi:5-(carboxyamino)imidazole ribonucleotide mutase [Desulfobacca acetoxidans]|uniref:N5-carboxyaminoimidazole ribonucleotide mutase n=1 Tax=Desulfobacca acetoxidans (strain ATCC 700848 / DSM 11109 / ASRB2) TaxID=880072 RepID=F2NEI6_DESAR|nr:5-(carboxyamino)imidazole ribonucleotide mutase [Desulfobacca acetoxidans]AEB08176.1 phosphoribosylaminoimidazole carboxylase, catalytic subunit [Desulfobacca acetoxidans DSM 11109]